MASRKILHAEDKLDALRKGDPGRAWESLDDGRSCRICGKTFSGRQIEVDPAGSGRLHCPTAGCSGSPRDWNKAGNPLLEDGAGDFGIAKNVNHTPAREAAAPPVKAI